jgi:hypothetical protein
MGNESLFSYAALLGTELNSLYRDNRIGRQDILEFMDANDWFELQFVKKGREPWLDTQDFEKLRKPLGLWLSAYRRPGRDKIALMLEHFSGTYPETCMLYERFIRDRNLADESSSWKLLDFLLSEIDKEITGYTETETEDLIRRLDNGATRSVAGLFADFLGMEKRDGRPISQWTYAFNTRDSPELINDAYPLADFATMAYCVFNEEMWDRQDLIGKAVRNKTYADLWLFVALHFICALRVSDMKRIPAPQLSGDGESILNKIKAGAFSKQETTAIVEDLRIRLKLKPLKPSKTSEYSNVPELRLFVPESLKAPLGLIMAIALAHHQTEIRAGECFINPSDSLSNIRDFFGEHFAKALGHRRFSSRRCNKSYLQGIDLSGGNERGKPKGYMLAALARSHKSGIGRLSETTDIYLRDANFSGYSPEFIIRQMFERGVFSFIPAVLLEIYAGDAYTKLPVSLQTELIGELGVAPQRIERLAEIVEGAMVKSRAVVGEILKNPVAIKENVFATLQNIASGNAPGKQKEYLCLMTAAGFRCAFPDRGNCIGCGYEIYTKTAMHTLMREYARLTHVRNGVGPSEARRCGQILERAVFPAITEMLTAAKSLYPEAEIAGLLDIMEEGIYYADCDPGRSGRKLQPFDGRSRDRRRNAEQSERDFQ